MDLSFIIPFYNGEKYISRLLYSIVKSYKARTSPIIAEIVIVIDSPQTDLNWLESLLIKQLAGEIDYIICKNEQNIGVAATRNVGLNIARGSSVVCIDQDDEIAESYFQHITQQIVEGYDFILYNGIFKFIDEDYQLPIHFIKPSINIRSLILFDAIRSPGQVIVNKHYLSSIGFPSPNNYYGADDRFCWILLFVNYPHLSVHYIAQPLYLALIHRHNFSNDNKQLYLSSIELWNKLLPLNYNLFKPYIIFIQGNLLFYKHQLNITKGLVEKASGYFWSFIYHCYPNKVIAFGIKTYRRLSAKYL